VRGATVLIGYLLHKVNRGCVCGRGSLCSQTKDLPVDKPKDEQQKSTWTARAVFGSDHIAQKAFASEGAKGLLVLGFFNGLCIALIASLAFSVSSRNYTDNSFPTQIDQPQRVQHAALQELFDGKPSLHAAHTLALTQLNSDLHEKLLTDSSVIAQGDALVTSIRSSLAARVAKAKSTVLGTLDALVAEGYIGKDAALETSQRCAHAIQSIERQIGSDVESMMGTHIEKWHKLSALYRKTLARVNLAILDEFTTQGLKTQDQETKLEHSLSLASLQDDHWVLHGNGATRIGDNVVSRVANLMTRNSAQRSIELFFQVADHVANDPAMIDISKTSCAKVQEKNDKDSCVQRLQASGCSETQVSQLTKALGFQVSPDDESQACAAEEVLRFLKFGAQKLTNIQSSWKRAIKAEDNELQVNVLAELGELIATSRSVPHQWLATIRPPK